MIYDHRRLYSFKRLSVRESKRSKRSWTVILRCCGRNQLLFSTLYFCFFLSFVLLHLSNRFCALVQSANLLANKSVEKKKFERFVNLEKKNAMRNFDLWTVFFSAVEKNRGNRKWICSSFLCNVYDTYTGIFSWQMVDFFWGIF